MTLAPVLLRQYYFALTPKYGKNCAAGQEDGDRRALTRKCQRQSQKSALTAELASLSAPAALSTKAVPNGRWAVNRAPHFRKTSIMSFPASAPNAWAFSTRNSVSPCAQSIAVFRIKTTQKPRMS